jgi:hypothetical protein
LKTRLPGAKRMSNGSKLRIRANPQAIIWACPGQWQVNSLR